MSGASALGRALLALAGARPLTLGRAPRPEPPRRVVVVSLGDNPSLDYYLRPRLAGVDHRIVALRADPEAALAAAGEGAYVVFCRYATRAWTRALERGSDRLAGAGLFIDDDVDAVVADPTAPLDYRLRLTLRHVANRERLSRRLDRLWTSTPALAARFPNARAVAIGPIAGAADEPRPRSGAGALRIAFHATGVHAAEHAWLMPLIERLIAERPGVAVEVVAEGALARRWRAVAAVSVVPPLPWPRYRETSAREGCDIALAPLFDTPANRARAATKRIDAFRAGAALIVNAPWVYDPSPEERALGMCPDPDPEAFLAAIKSLIDAPERRLRLAALNAERVRSLAAEARPLFERA